MESWIVESRRKTCIACEKREGCEVVHTILLEVSACPLALHPSRIDAISARAWPAGVDAISGCCDSVN